MIGVMLVYGTGSQAPARKEIYHALQSLIAKSARGVYIFPWFLLVG
jgi:hypothetical protein